MRFQTAILSVIFAAAATTAQSVDELVSQIPTCAQPCLADASEAVGCSATDSACQCNHSTDVQKNAIVCVSSSCSEDELNNLLSLTTQICKAVASGSASSAVASATGSGNSTVSSATLTASTSATATPGAANHAQAGMGMLGAAALAAMVL
ncbi:hypothetical protein F5Y15DRAFT_418772 [Xylariaceae sp. FL0016]|nr:hypothetical protein F5Y15DRAFT_418772 [Xylariaceae sp. FL0016]